jgi:hypothetical protein
MYYEAVKSAFSLFPLDPPGNLSVGDYVRIDSSGRVLHCGNLGTLLGVEIEQDKTSHAIEFLSQGVAKAGVSTEAASLAKAKIAFSNAPGLYLRGKRTVFKMHNFSPILARLAKTKADWSIRYRIVIETHVVEKADIVCANSTSADMSVSYNDQGLPIELDTSYAKQKNGLLHLPNISGTIAFGAIRFWRPIGTFGGAAVRPFEYRVLDVNDTTSFEDNMEDINGA